MDVSDAKRLKTLEDENAKLKKLLADQMLEASALRELLSKKWEGPPPSAKPSSAGPHGHIAASGMLSMCPMIVASLRAVATAAMCFPRREAIRL